MINNDHLRESIDRVTTLSAMGPEAFGLLTQHSYTEVRNPIYNSFEKQEVEG